MRPNPNAVGIGTVIAAELDDIANRRGDASAKSVNPARWEQECLDRRLFGVSFSGGGIRSATFGLGILQGLAERDLLPKVDYVSTVSGGGYIGSWLQGVLYRSNLGPKGFDALKPQVPGPPSTDPISFLRKYSDYLSPRTGLSLDAVVIPIIWVRNTLLNQVIIVTAFLTFFVLMLLPGAAVRYVAQLGQGKIWWTSLVVVVAAAAFAVMAIGYNLRKIQEREFGDDGTPAFASGKGTRRVSTLVVLPLLIAVVFLLPVMFAQQAKEWVGGGFLILWALLAALQWRGGFVSCCKQQGQSRDIFCWLHVVWMSCASAFFMLLLFLALNNVILAPNPDHGGGTTQQITISQPSSGSLLKPLRRPQNHLEAQRAITLAPPLYLVVLMAGVTLLIGLMGRDFPDASREWLARVGALLWIAAFTWVAVFGFAIYIPYWIIKLWLLRKSAILSGATAWIASTIASVLAGKSGKTGSVETDKAGASISLDKIARYGPFLAVGGFLAALALALQIAIRVSRLPHDGAFLQNFVVEYWKTLPYSDAEWRFPFILLIIAASIFIVFSVRVNINEFSMHHFYKNRLVRCFLGASAAMKRQPDSFTGFDPKDDIPLDKLKCDSLGATVAPFPILNATLTVTVGSELATQERKATPWIFTPLYSGFAPQQSVANQAAAMKAGAATAAYVDTSKLLGGGMRLGTAMAISGAALNPGDGFNSAPQTAFLMTLFDVRLGWWIGNPRDEGTYRRTGPRVALLSLGRELFGSLNDRSAYLNLSDGGNFENLGLYELVRRRCRYVIAVDGEQDPDYAFRSLGGAVRKCREDFGIEIDINPRPIVALQGLSSSHCIVGRIHYPEPDAEPGWLLYIKASMTGDEPADVEEYRREHSDFPQQSTTEQFFLESQFESYRRLGLHEVRTTFGPIGGLPVEDLFERLGSRWQLPPKAPEGSLAPHADEYSKLLEKLAESKHLISLDAEVLENFPTNLAAEGPQRSAFFFRRQLLELIESIFLELHFASSHAWNHPANAGWKRVFEYWARQDAIKVLWESQRLNFGKPFQHFFDDLINGRTPPPSERHI